LVHLDLAGRDDHQEIRLAGGTMGLNTWRPKRTSLETEPPRWLMP